MNAVISVIGKDCVGILAYVSDECAKANANILDVSQSVLKDYFAMIMVVNIDSLNVDFTKFVGTIYRLFFHFQIIFSLPHLIIFFYIQYQFLPHHRMLQVQQHFLNEKY